MHPVDLRQRTSSPGFWEYGMSYKTKRSHTQVFDHWHDHTRANLAASGTSFLVLRGQDGGEQLRGPQTSEYYDPGVWKYTAEVTITSRRRTQRPFVALRRYGERCPEDHLRAIFCQASSLHLRYKALHPFAKWTAIEDNYTSVSRLVWSTGQVRPVSEHGLESGELIEADVLEEFALVIFALTMTAISEMHGRSVLHDNLDQTNVFFDDKLHPTCTDFGYAKPVLKEANEQEHVRVGYRQAFGYAAPETTGSCRWHR
ncbi:hypothetical protein QFC20_002543 [Naganishia adeliensis]|uniref:Uncharacterized protein n=1 Tax=Naganishia adeliensis TaxID=92952 RepID=A0ACC2WJB7_9TREE|nr:hypothetical protein QFC20_002543 [Naganishia adeliensis]